MKQQFSKFGLALTLSLAVSACGKNMNVQVPGEKKQEQNQIADVAKINVPTQELTNFSNRDFNDLGITENALHKRAIIQIPPAEAVKSIIQFSVLLKEVVLDTATPASVCTLEGFKKCYALKKNTEGFYEASLLEKDTRVEDIAKTGVAFAEPSYYKIRLAITGVKSFKSGALYFQTEVDQKLLPKDFNVATCLEHEDDQPLTDEQVAEVLNKAGVEVSKSAEEPKQESEDPNCIEAEVVQKKAELEKALLESQTTDEPTIEIKQESSSYPLWNTSTEEENLKGKPQVN